jgi:hypothetical protein
MYLSLRYTTLLTTIFEFEINIIGMCIYVNVTFWSVFP